MKVLSVGEFKAKFSNVVQDLLNGSEVAIAYGKKKEKIGVLVPYQNYKKKKKIKLGLLHGKARVKFAKEFRLTTDEFLNS